MLRAGLLCLAVVVGLFLLPGCGEEPLSSLTQPDNPIALDASKKKLDHVELCAEPDPEDFTLDATNPYFPMDVGTQWVLEGEDEGLPFVMLFTALNRTRVIDGVTTRVMEEREFLDGELFEITWNYHAEAPDGTNCYFGEDVDIFEDGQILHDGAWCAEDNPDVNKPGIFMPADPKAGMFFETEVAPGVAEDVNKVVGPFGSVTVPFGTVTETIRLRELNRLEGAKDYKTWGRGVGILIDGPIELVRIIQNAPDPVPQVSDPVCGT